MEALDASQKVSVGAGRGPPRPRWLFPPWPGPLTREAKTSQIQRFLGFDSDGPRTTPTWAEHSPPWLDLRRSIVFYAGDMAAGTDRRDLVELHEAELQRWLETTDLIVVANRLPLRVDDQDASPAWVPSPGGLVAALSPALRSAERATWVGWGGAPGPTPSLGDRGGVSIVPVVLDAVQIEKYYEGFSNATIWPLYHDSIETPMYHRSWWDSYVEVNQRFTDSVVAVAPPGAVVWVHDYQLQLVPEMLRAQRGDVKIGFFLHIPFPAPELFLRLPWRSQIIRGILGADVVGFQTEVARDNFLTVVERTTRAMVDRPLVSIDGRSCRVDSFPIGIDADRIIDAATSDATARRVEELRVLFRQPRKVILGVDRLDYTKGIELRLRALQEMLADGRIDPAETVIVQIAEPSRGGTRGYGRIKTEVERISGGINGDHAQLGRPVLEYHHRSVDLEELVALFRLADVMLVTPFADGMNLVAKEYVAARTDLRGVLVLSEFAGASRELTAALLVNPYDINGVKEVIEHALAMPPEEQEARMRILNDAVQANTVAAWAESFLRLLVS
jgi:trehalose 6-phosphate synthase/phosphatase